jgi:putative Mg2+ transporter-C (MgtC) family protein
VLCGSGYPLYGLTITATVLGINIFLRPLAEWIDAHRRSAPDAGAVYRLQVVCLEREAAVVRSVILRHVNGHAGLSVHGLSSQDTGEPGCQTVAAEVMASRADDKAMAEVMNRLSIEPGVRSVRWEKRPAEGTT